MNLPQIIPGVITDGPTEEAPAETLSYLADVNVDGTLHSNVPVNRPVIHQWGTIVRPLPKGTAIVGVSVNGYIQWLFRELPALGPCNGDGGSDPGNTPIEPGGGAGSTPIINPGITLNPIRPARSLVRDLLMTASDSELRAFFRAFIAAASSDNETMRALKAALEKL